MDSYERLSKFRVNKNLFCPKRPNSGEKPRNKSFVFSVEGTDFGEVPVVNYNSTIQVKGKRLVSKHKSLIWVKKNKLANTPKQRIVNRSAYLIPSRPPISIVKKSAMRKPVLDHYSRSRVIRMLKQSLVSLDK